MSLDQVLRLLQHFPNLTFHWLLTGEGKAPGAARRKRGEPDL
jgi:hypothetical protein